MGDLAAQLKAAGLSRVTVSMDATCESAQATFERIKINCVLLRGFIVRAADKKEARRHIGEPGFLKPSRSMVHIGG